MLCGYFTSIYRLYVCIYKIQGIFLSEKQTAEQYVHIKCLYKTKVQMCVYIHTNEEKRALGWGVGLRLRGGS